MSVFLFGNLVGSTLAGAISAVATTINLAAGTGTIFPPPAAGKQFALRLISASNSSYYEIVYVTAISGDALTVVRAQEGTTALTFNAGDLAKHVLTAGALSSFGPAANTNHYGVDAGAVNAMAATVAPAITALADGMVFIIDPAYANTSSTVTFNPSGLGAVNILRADGSALHVGDLLASSYKALLIYDSGSGNFLLQNPAEALAPTPTRVLYLTTTQTITVAANETRCEVEGWGGGGGGGAGSTGLAGAGGGGGGKFLDYMTGLTVGQTITATIGAGGNGGISGFNGVGGGATSFGARTANGGAGGLANSQLASSGGSASGGSVNLTGGTGGPGLAISGAYVAGYGGASPGGGTGGAQTYSVSDGGRSPGGGGSGAANNNVGGNGATGMIIVKFYP